jgi:hypothetical protein
MTGPEDIAPAMDWTRLAAQIAATQPKGPETAPTWPDPHEAAWAGTGFSRPGPAEHSAPSRELFWATLEDALTFTADRDNCNGYQGAQLCETHTSRAARTEQYLQALKQEMEAGPSCPLRRR